MSELSYPPYQTIPIRELGSPGRRAEFEARYGTAIAGYAHEFSGGEHYEDLQGIEAVGEEAIRRVAKASGVNLGLKAIKIENFDNPDDTFSGGFWVLSAPTRKSADYYHPRCIEEVNFVLRSVKAGIRLTSHPHAN